MAEQPLTGQATETTGTTASSGQRRGNNRRRGQRNGNSRGGRGGRPVRGGNEEPQGSSASEPVNAGTPAPNQDASRSRDRGGRRGRGDRSRRGNNSRATPAMPATVGQRAFGGRLTTDAPQDDAAALNASLSADAAEFVPGQPVASRPAPQKAPKTRAPKPAVNLPKSTAADLGTRIHEDISNRNYECAICTDDVIRSSHIWSCGLCFTVVHEKCVRQWYKRSIQGKQDTTWRCPGCNSSLTDEPASYHCWCGKETKPAPASRALPPHSCGQTCSKPRGTCPHPCFLQCHAGPCPPCDLMGPVQSCFCGKNTSQKLCRETDYSNGESCGEICGDLLPCGEHVCEQPCHSGVCGDCTAVVEARCFCGRETKEIRCSLQDDPQDSFDLETNEEFEGTFDCQKVCGRPFDCGVHKCSRDCHGQDEEPAHCPYSPDSVRTCPCGKTDLSTLLDTPRQHCQDEVPHCNEPCGKLLSCGHACEAACHVGDCGSCSAVVDILCRCGRTSTSSICHQGDMQRPFCMRVCQAQMSCARHACGERCCPGEKKAVERKAAQRKGKLQNPNQPVEAEHVCIQTCERPLKCGQHNCQQLCHRGACNSCPEAIFDEIACNCGRTVLQPPQPCGTRPPDCRFPCRRPTACGHPIVSHNCHTDDVSCPKCPYQVQRWCLCGKRNMPNQPCHLQEAHCGLVCGKKLKCGLHTCRKLCHGPGRCEDEGSDTAKCTQACGKAKLVCDHPCPQSCHGMTPCNENTPCSAKAKVACPCGLRTQEVRCAASSSNPSPERPEMKCDDECLRQERNRRLATALNIDPETHQNDHIPYDENTLRMFRETKKWCEKQEREFRVFANSPEEVRLQYKPMPAEQRQFLHFLAEDYGFDTRSEDTEPWRYVVVLKGSRFVSAPSKTLAQCIAIRDKQAAESRKPSPPPEIIKTEPFNAFLLLDPRFALTLEDVATALKKDLDSQPSFSFNISFLPSEEVTIRATANYSSFLDPAAVETALSNLKPQLAETIGRTKIAGKIVLCHLDTQGEVLRRETVAQMDGAGWSAVATRAKQQPEKVEEPAVKPGGRRLLGLKKKKPADVVRDNGKAFAALGGSDVEC